MTRPWRPAGPLTHDDDDDLRPEAGTVSPDVVPPPDAYPNEDFTGDADGALDLVWLGDASRGLDEFVPVTRAAPRLVPARYADIDAPDIAAMSSPFRPTPPPWRWRRVALPALLVLAGVAVVSSLETQAPAPVPALPEPPSARVGARPSPDPRSTVADPSFAPLPDTALPPVRVEPPAQVAPRAPARSAIDTPREPRPARPARTSGETPRPAIAAPDRVPSTPPRSQIAVRQPPGATVTPPLPSVTAIVERGGGPRAIPDRLPEPPSPTIDAAAPPAREPAPPNAEPPRPAPERAAARVSTGAAAPRPEIETQAIEQVLGEYRSAFNRRDAGAAAAVWPSVNEKALARAFEGLAQQSVEFDQCQIEIAADRAHAACRGKARYVPNVGSRTPRTDARQWRFNLGRTAGRWTIVSVEAR